MARIEDLISPAQRFDEVKLRFIGDYKDWWTWSTSAPFPDYFEIRGRDTLGGWDIIAPGTTHTFYTNADDDFWELWSPPVTATTKSGGCSCDIHLLMRAGCQCGSFTREQEAKGNADVVAKKGNWITLNDLLNGFGGGIILP